MTPDDLLDPAKLPDDLKLLVTQFKLQPNDPVYLLLIWHWRRVQGTEDILKTRTMELQAALDTRVAKVEAAVAKIESAKVLLASLTTALEQKPLALTRRMEADLKAPIADAIQNLRSLDKSMADAMGAARETLGAAGRRQALAALVAGFTAGLFLATFFWTR